MMLLSQACLIHWSWPSARRLVATKGLAQAWGRGPDSQQLEEQPRTQILTSHRGGWVNLPPSVAWRVRAGGSPTLGPDATCKHPPLRGQGVPFPINRSCHLHRLCLLKRPSFSEGRKPPSVMVMPPPCPRNLKNKLFPKRGHFHAPQVLPCQLPTF